MKRNDDTIGADRAGGTSRRSGNPPAISVSRAEEFTPGSTPPEPLLPAQLKDMVVRDGFSDGDTPQVESILNRISYQHLSEYYRIAKSEHAPGDAGYKLVHRIALFDRKLQSVLMEGIGLFELQFRAQYSYALGASHGAFAHRSSGNLKDIGHYRSSMSKYFTEVERQISRKNASVLREVEMYGDLPIWCAVEIMSFGTLSMLYGNTRSKRVRAAVADSFGIQHDTLTSWIRALSAVRNQCAHFGNICSQPLTSRPKRSASFKFKDNGHFFYIALILENLLGGDELYPDDPTITYSLSFAASIAKLFNEFHDLLPIVGIPRDWGMLMLNEEVTGARWKHVDAGDAAEMPEGPLVVGDGIAFTIPVMD